MAHEHSAVLQCAAVYCTVRQTRASCRLRTWGPQSTSGTVLRTKKQSTAGTWARGGGGEAAHLATLLVGNLLGHIGGYLGDREGAVEGKGGREGGEAGTGWLHGDTWWWTRRCSQGSRAAQPGVIKICYMVKATVDNLILVSAS